jgi:hypothetical protein
MKPLSDFRLYICIVILSKILSHFVRDGCYRRVMSFKLHPSVAIFLDVTFGNTRSFEMGANSILN